ncbi:Elongation of very long chain fatty acids protein 4 [Eumeta japonica]|uniref:Elongation of very long chain fatty acids protein n=1 Tax=Eumeta variegata TaxID=151549 RepID=A0A4C1VPK9_EUMVA|nr:Elongation of very long chain fatty acids protein 4 [Eumeta japonica]
MFSVAFGIYREKFTRRPRIPDSNKKITRKHLIVSRLLNARNVFRTQFRLHLSIIPPRGYHLPESHFRFRTGGRRISSAFIIESEQGEFDTRITFLPAMVNSAIHVLMYAYYGLSVFGPAVSRYLWWKKYLTILQLIQFTCALILGVNGIRTGCEFPLWMHYVLIIYMISFIVLFGNFYMKAYIAKGSKCMEIRYGQNLDDEITLSKSKLKDN